MINTENKFEYNGLIYIAVEADGCRGCDFSFRKRRKRGCKVKFESVPPCRKEERKDNKNVVFVLSDIDNEGKEQ